jgi:glycosyltransferase involved in cell wall biosynthesis
MGESVKPKIALSAVNLVNLGPLAVVKEAVASLAENYSDRYEIVALVHRRALFDTPNVTYLEFPKIKGSWVRRLWFEYHQLKQISSELQPKLWLSMHDMTANVVAPRQAVYCHNPSPFYRFRSSEALFDWKFGMFTLLYRFLYRINIHSNQFVIVQQDWIRNEFQRLYGVKNVIVAQPRFPRACPIVNIPRMESTPYRFFFPAFPRTFKNPELLLSAARILENSGFHDFELWLTFDASVNKFGASLLRKFGELRTVRWLGVIPRNRVFELYGEADCLLFPSKLETWGLPITEFKSTGKPMMVADLPYAHETVGTYSQVAFFNTEEPEQLAALMKRAASGEAPFASASREDIAQPFSRNWSELWKLLLTDN